MKIYEFEQGTEEWKEVRRLKLTASHGTEIGNNGKGLVTYVAKKVLDAIVEPEEINTKDMERGNILEPIARSVYEFEKGVVVREVGFIEYNEYSGYSPDGLIEQDYLGEGKGLIEIKARNNAKHLALLLGGLTDSSVRWQMQLGMLMTGRKWCDFISYNPNFKQSLFVKRFYVDEKAQEKLRVGLESGIKMLKEQLQNKIVVQELNN
jgi:hypothetical protein